MQRIATLAPDVLMVGGAACVLGGVYLVLGVAWVLIIGGIVAVVYGGWLDIMAPDEDRRG